MEVLAIMIGILQDFCVVPIINIHLIIVHDILKQKLTTMQMCIIGMWS